MTTPPALVIFDVDGTLVDSQAHIVAALSAMYDAGGRPLPPRARLLSIVGLSLPQAIARLEPDLAEAELGAWAEAYRAAFVTVRAAEAPSPLYPGALAALDGLASLPHMRLGVATGKSRRGLAHVFAAHDLAARFVTTQTADDHPSKPHPSMIEAALAETGVPAARAVMVGDTTFDIEMGRAAGIATVGVSWGYHAPDALRAAGAGAVIAGFADLAAAIGEVSRGVA